MQVGQAVVGIFKIWEMALSLVFTCQEIPDDRGYLRCRVFVSRKIWDGRETVKSQSVWDFPDI